MYNYKFTVGDFLVCELNTTMEILGMEFDNCDARRYMYVAKLNGKRTSLWDASIVEKHYKLVVEVVHSYRMKLADGTFDNWKDCSAEHAAHVMQGEFAKGFEVRKLYKAPN